MIAILTLAALYAGLRLAIAAADALAAVPRRNEDMIFY
jgi:hypothetical protein